MRCITNALHGSFKRLDLSMDCATLAHFGSASSMAHDGAPSSWHGSAGGIFWSAGIGSGAAAIVQLCAPVDAMSERIGQLPVRPALTRPASPRLHL